MSNFFVSLRRFIRSSPIGAIALLVWVLIILMAIFAPGIAPHDPLEPTYSEEGPSAAHWLGTDRLGRDVLSRIIFGARITLIVAFTGVLLGDTIGFLWGISSGYLGNRIDLISQRNRRHSDVLSEPDPGAVAPGCTWCRFDHSDRCHRG